jgi:hypothetical protein
MLHDLRRYESRSVRILYSVLQGASILRIKDWS